MLELGAFWAYHSLWFKHVFPQGDCALYELDAAHLAVGQRNFAKNGFSGHFEVAAAGLDGNIEFFDETRGQASDIIRKASLQFVVNVRLTFSICCTWMFKVRSCVR